MTETDRLAAHGRLERELSVILRRSRSVSIALAREVHEGLEAAEYGLLRVLDDAGELRASDVATAFGLDKSTVSRQLSHVESMGLVERVPDPEDGRARLIRLTDEGRARVHETRERRRTHVRTSLEDWSTQDVSLLADLLGRLNLALEPRDS